jgi:hypothetical protein
MTSSLVFDFYACIEFNIMHNGIHTYIHVRYIIPGTYHRGTYDMYVHECAHNTSCYVRRRREPPRPAQNGGVIDAPRASKGLAWHSV